MNELNAGLFAKNLKIFRLRKGMQQKELAYLCNFHICSISNWENGKYQCDLFNLCKLASALDVTPNDFFLKQPEYVGRKTKVNGDNVQEVGLSVIL